MEMLFFFPQRSVIALLFILLCVCYCNYKCICSIMTMVWSRNKKFSTRNNPHCAQNLQKKARPRSPKQLPEQKFLNQIFVLTWACRDSSASFHPRCTSQSQPLAYLLCYLLYWQIKCLCYYLVSLPICRGVPETPQEKQQECIAGEGYSAMVPT